MTTIAREVNIDGVLRLDADGVAQAQRPYALFAVCGQSNATGQGDSATSETPSSGIEIKTSGTRIDPIRDPVGQTDGYFDPANTGSAWPAFCGRYYNKTGQVPIILSIADAGAGLHYNICLSYDSWLRDCYAPSKTAIDNALSTLVAAGYDFDFRGIIWWQGYTDGNECGYSTATYQADLETLYGDYKADYPGYAKFKFYVMECPKNMPLIQAAKQGFVANHGDAYLVYSNSTDTVHLDQIGLNAAGHTVAETIAGIL